MSDNIFKLDIKCLFSKVQATVYFLLKCMCSNYALQNILIANSINNTYIFITLGMFVKAPTSCGCR